MLAMNQVANPCYAVSPKPQEQILGCMAIRSRGKRNYISLSLNKHTCVIRRMEEQKTKVNQQKIYLSYETKTQ